MKLTLNSTTGKLVASTVVLGAAASVAGLGTFGTFSSATSASENVASGTVNIALGATGANNRLSVAASGLVPGDTVQRAVTLSNTGDQNLSGIALTTAATTSSKLDSDAAMGLQLKIQSCATAWTEAGTAPAYTYTCASPTTVVATRPVVGSAVPMSALTSVTITKTDNLLVTLTLPDTADNTLQGQSSVIGFTFTGTQRAATNK